MLESSETKVFMRGQAKGTGRTMSSQDEIRVPGSFRDPSGFLFHSEGILYRQVNHSYAAAYRQLMDSGLYAALSEAGLLVAHEELSEAPAPAENAYTVIRPEIIPLVSYPYEWCFGQLRAAALATLEIHRRALEHGMVLKDASAYNVQFVGARPVFIDTLSFAPYAEGQPWVAYRQFCQHFLAPLALMSRCDIRFGQWLRAFIDGIPLDLASRALPRRSYLSLGLCMHLHMHARSEAHYAQASAKESSAAAAKARLSRTGMLGMVDNLTATVRGLQWQPPATEWAAYYEATNYTESSMTGKERIVAGFLEHLRPGTVWDLGANTGRFSRLASGRGAYTAAFDIDPAAVEFNYRQGVEKGESNLLPLWLDLANPSPALGWAHQERQSWMERGPADVVMALALIHHLALTNNVPLPDLARFFARVARTLIIEFVPKGDSQVQRMLASREDIFTEYSQPQFETAFRRYFAIDETVPIPGTERTLYRMTAL